ncbi:MAG: glucosylceramidase [Lachnospiraceae bacterium]|nr:glucosylceramidase [Lachnospiraceae bacterium]
MNSKIRVIKTDVVKGDFLKEEPALKFKKDASVPDGIELEVVNVYDEVKYQEILGFGAAFTDSSAVNYAKMSRAEQEEVSDAYFSRKKGIALNFNRICINSSDYAADFYTCDDVDGDKELKYFNIDHDKKEIIPMIKDALKRCPEMMIFASPWSAPAWMKDNGKMERGGRLKKEYLATWALFYARFIQEYGKAGVPVWGLTIQNEAKADQWWESMLYEAAEERDFAAGYLRPTLDREGLGDTKVFCWDHNKERVVDRALETFGTNSGRAAFDGIAYHWYAGDHFEALDAVHQLYPEKIQISTENSGGARDDLPWYVGEHSAHEIFGDFKNYCSAFVAWNMILDETGHPYHWDAERDAARKKAENAFVNQSIRAKTRPSTPIMWWEGKVRYELSYYYIGQFSKYVLPGAKRIGSSSYSADLEQIAFLNPDGTIVLVVMNKGDKELPVVLRHKNNIAKDNLAAHSIATYIF